MKVTTIYFLRLFCYAVLGGFLKACGVLASRDWEFWAIMGLVVAIDILSRAENNHR